MDTLLFPVPLWILLLIVFAVGVVFDIRHRRLKRRMDRLDRVIDNMDRWADDIEDMLRSDDKRTHRHEARSRYANKEKFPS